LRSSSTYFPPVLFLISASFYIIIVIIEEPSLNGYFSFFQEFFEVFPADAVMTTGQAKGI